MKHLATLLIAVLIGLLAQAQTIADFEDWTGDGLDDHFKAISGRFHIVSRDPDMFLTAQHGQGNVAIQTNFPLDNTVKVHSFSLRYRSTSPVIIKVMATPTMVGYYAILPAEPDEPAARTIYYKLNKQHSVIIASPATCMQFDDVMFDAVLPDAIEASGTYVEDNRTVIGFDVLGRRVR